MIQAAVTHEFGGVTETKSAMMYVVTSKFTGDARSCGTTAFDTTRYYLGAREARTVGTREGSAQG